MQLPEGAGAGFRSAAGTAGWPGRGRVVQEVAEVVCVVLKLCKCLDLPNFSRN